MSLFRIAIPSKGTLAAPTRELFDGCFLPVAPPPSARSYTSAIHGLDGVSVLFARADEIPDMVESGHVHIGVTGLDLFLESRSAVEIDEFFSPGDPDGAQRPRGLVIADLGFGRARLELGVPATWIDVNAISDLIEVGHEVRHRRNRPLLIATKFPALCRSHFRRVHFSDFRLVQSLGATEAAPKSGSADVIVDLVSSGATFEDNGLRTIEGGRVMSSQACMIGSTNPNHWSDDGAAAFRHVAELLIAGLVSRRSRTLRATFGGATRTAPEELAKLLSDTHLSHSLAGDLEVRGHFRVDDVHRVLAAVRANAGKSAVITESNLIFEGGAREAEIFLREVQR